MISKTLKDMKKKIITIEDFIDKEKSVLKSKTQRLTFPLSEEDKNIIILMKEILFALDGVGLAAPQIDINKNIAVIYIPETASLLRNNAKIYPMHTIINAEYEPVKDQGKYSDFEACYSVKTICGQVPRYNIIKVKYQNEEGLEISKIETGFYARVLQHEIDHLNGVLITDVLTPDCLQGTFEEMAKLRRESLTEEKKILFDKLVKKKNLKQKD
jgi:peptide deformylase